MSTPCQIFLRTFRTFRTKIVLRRVLSIERWNQTSLISSARAKNSGTFSSTFSLPCLIYDVTIVGLLTFDEFWWLSGFSFPSFFIYLLFSLFLDKNLQRSWRGHSWFSWTLCRVFIIFLVLIWNYVLEILSLSHPLAFEWKNALKNVGSDS